MTESDGWYLHVSGTGGEPEEDRIAVVRRRVPQIRLEIDAPGIRSAGEDQIRQARLAIQAAVTALQEALDSPSAIAGLH